MIFLSLECSRPTTGSSIKNYMVRLASRAQSISVACANGMRCLSCAGPISSVTAMGQTITIINDSRIAVELLEKRSAIHSSRPKQLFAGEMYVKTITGNVQRP